MPLPLKIIMFDPGPGGSPTTNNPRDLSGWIEELSDSLCNEFGSESLSLTGYVDSIEAAIDFTQRLMSSVEVYTPTGRARFFGFLHGVTVPVIHCSVSMEDLANVVILRYTTPNNVKGTETASNAASIARYGRKEVVLNYSDVLAAEATNRAAMILGLVQEPPNTEPVNVDKGEEPPFRVDLTFRGWAETLKWVTTANTTQTTAVTSTQVTALITAYNLVNNFFDTAGAAVTSTAFSATQYCPPDTTYYDRIQTLLSAGDSSQRRVAWGFYTRAITIGTAAAATPDTIAYSYSRRKAELRDANGNIIPPWDWTPDCMIQNVDAIVPPAPTGALATLTRKYIRRVTLRMGIDGIPHGNMEPDDVKNLPSFLAKPVSTDTGASARHAAIEARIAKAVRSRTFNTDGPSFNPVTGVIQPSAGGTGISNTGTIDLGGGSIGNTGGGNVDLGTGANIGGSGSTGVSTGGGTPGAVTKWATSSTLTDAISGTDYAAAGHSHAASGAPDDAKYIVQQAHAGLSAEQALGALATGLLKNTTSTGVLSIAAASDLPNHASRHENGGADEVALDASQTTTGVFATARLGSGTANSTTFLRGDSTWQALSTITPATIGAAPDDATYITQTSNGTLTNEQALGSLATGLLKNTTTTGVLSIAAASDLPNHASRHANGGADEVALDTSQITTGTMATARLGSGTASEATYLHGNSTWAALDASDLSTGTVPTARLGSGTANSTTFLRGDQTWAAPAGSAINGSGASTRVAFWLDADTLSSSANFVYSSGANALTAGNVILTGSGHINALGTLQTGAQYQWDFGGYVAGTPAADTGVLFVNVSGAEYQIPVHKT